MLLGKDRRYVRSSFIGEEEIDKVVIDNATLLFGPYSIVLPKRMISTEGGRDTIPDGFVIELNKREWYLVEVETSKHDTWDHISKQIMKQLTALQSERTKHQ